MIEQDINERMARFAPSQAGPDVDPIAAEIAARASVPSAQPTMQEASGVDPIAMQIATRQRESLNAAVLGARSVNPDEATQAEQLGQRIGIGPEIARADMARAEQQAYLMDLRAKDYPRTDPILANYLESRQFAETAHDDLGVLEMVKPILFEAALIKARGAPALFDAVSRGYERGKKQMELGEMQAMGMVRYPTPKEREDIENLTKEIQALGRGGVVGIGAEMIGQYAANLKEIGAFSAGGAAIGSVIPGVGTALGGALGLAAGILKTGGTPIAGNLYATLNEKGVSDDVAIPAAIAGGFIGGLVEVVGGKIAAMPVQALAKRVMAETLSEALTRPTLQQAAKEFVKAYGLQVGGEAFEEGTQAISDMLAEEIALAASGIDSELTMREGFMRVIESALYGAAGSAILGGVGPGANLLIDLRRASNTERQTKVFEDLAANRKESKYANRNPVGYERFLASQAEGTTAETIYVDGRIAQQVLAQSGVPTAQLEEILPGIRERIAEAVQTGGDVTIPTARFGARLANTDLGNALLPHMRLSPDAMSATEAQEFATRRQEVVREAEQILAQKQEADATFVQQARQIHDRIRQQALAAGQEPAVADVAASMYQAFVVTQAAEEKITPAQVESRRRRPLTIEQVGELSASAPMAPRMEIAPGVMAPARPAGMTSAAYERVLLREFEAPTLPSAGVSTIQTQTDAASTSIDQSAIPAKAKSGLGISVKQIGTALRQGNAVELANALWKLRERMSKLETVPAELQALAASIEERLASLGITIEVPQIGAEDRGGQEVERVSVMPNKDSAQVFDRIKTVMAPVVRRNGAVISRGQVVVEAGAEAFEAQRAAALDVETQRVDAEINERMARIRQAATAAAPLEQAATVDVSGVATPQYRRAWHKATTGQPITVTTWHSPSGTTAAQLTDFARERMNRDTTLGGGWYGARDRDIAEIYGTPEQFEVTLQNPFVFSEPDKNFVLKLTNEELQRIRDAGYDGIIVKGVNATLQGQDRSHLQVVAFNPEQAVRRTSPNIMEQAATMDAEYMAAVERGDMETAQRMVDEAAKARGMMFRGHKRNRPQGVTETFVSESREQAQQFANQHSDGVVSLVRFTKPLRVYEQLIPWQEYQDSWRNSVLLKGYDAVRVIEPNGQDTSLAIRNQESIGFESADPVTYDEAGNVIPLSRRFDITSPRIFEQAAQAAVQPPDRELGPIEAAKVLVQQTGRKAFTDADEFFKKRWAELLKKTRRQVKPTPRNFREAAKRAVSDILDFVKANPKFADYYANDWKVTRSILDDYVGRAITDDEFLMFRAIAGLTSPNTMLPANISDTVGLWDHWMREGNFDAFTLGPKPGTGALVVFEAAEPISGTTANVKVRTIRIIERLIKERGGVTQAFDYLQEGVPVKELHKFNRKMGYAGAVGDIGNITDLVQQATGQSELIPRMFIFGQKVGAYTLNAIGDERYTTVDIWESRYIRSHFTGMFDLNIGLPESTDEHQIFTRFGDLFKEEMEAVTGRKWAPSALQALRWFYIIGSAREAGYSKASTNETISFYTERRLVQAFGYPGRAATSGGPSAGAVAPGGAAGQVRAARIPPKRFERNLESDVAKLTDPADRRRAIAAGYVRYARYNSELGQRGFSFDERRGGPARQHGILNATVAAEFVPGERLRSAFEKANLPIQTMQELVANAEGAQAFRSLVAATNSSNPYGAAVAVYTADDYQGKRLFVTEDATAGFALTADGDIVSVFSAPKSGNGRALMTLAVQAGGRRLDCFDTALPAYYAAHGFKSVARLAWNDKEAPAGWDTETFQAFNGGRPDVVFMVYERGYNGEYKPGAGAVVPNYNDGVQAQDRALQSIAKSQMFEQAAAGPARGGFDPRRVAIMLTRATDRTTMWHELVHFFLNEYTEMVADGSATARTRNDLDLLLKWFKIEGDTADARFAKWVSMSLEEQRKHHEALTYNAEIYAFEGKAPSAELVPVFERLRAFMLRVYKSIRDDLNAIYRREFGEDLPILTGEVRQVMDRMLATDEQIKRQAAINEMKPQFQTQEQSGMDDAEWAAYQAMQQEAIEASITDMNKASMRQLQWLGNARSRILRDMQKKHDAKRKEVAAEVAAELRVEPVYRAMTYLRTGKFIDADGAEVEMEGPHRLDIKQVKAIYAGMPSEEAVEPIRATGMAVPVTRPQFERLGYGKYGMLAEDGVAPDLVAETFGYGSGDQMIRALLEAKPIKEAVAERTDAEMLRRYGDMNTPEAQEAEVQKALHNEARARFVAVELRHIARATEPVRVMLEAAKQVARELIAGMTLRDVRPGDFVAAEARAARDASRVGTTIDAEAIGRAAQTRALNEALEAGTDPAEAMAAAMEKGAEAARKAQERSDALKAQYGADPQQALIRAKRAQLYQNQLAAEALRVREEVAKQVKYLRRILRDTNVKAMGAQAADQVAALLERFEVAPVSLKRLDERKALETWLDEQEAAGLVPDIAPEVANEARRVNYQQLTVAEFRDLVDAIRQIEFIGKNERKVQLAAERAAYEEKRDEIVARIRAVGRLRGVRFDPRSPLTNIGRAAAALRGFAAQHLKAASIARILDGGEDDGPLWTFAIRSANAAADMETRMRAEASAKLAEILAPVFKLGNMGGKGVFFPSINLSLNREARIAIAMNVGNDGNRQRLLDGEGWTMEQVQPVLESLTEAEWKAVQQVWDYIDTYRPLIAEKERRLYGKEPEWVKATPFTTRTADGREVRLDGGYYPIKYDPIASDRVATVDEAAEAKRALDGAYTATTTRRSFVKSRVREVVGRPLLYTLDAAFGGVNDVIHDLAWHEWLIQTQRLLRDPEFANAVRETRGPEYLKQLRDWTKDNAAGERKIGVAGEAALSWLRKGISASGLGFNIVSAIMQVTGFNQSIVRLGAKYVGRGVAQFAASPIDTSRMVADKSSFMAERGRTQFREINEIRNRVRGQTKVARRVTSGTYFLMMNMQRTVDIPTWLAGYQKALDAGKDDATAVALADQAVRDTQGSGLISDLAAIERGGPMMKLFTVFYSYMNTVYNMTAVQTMTARGKGKLAADYVMLLVVPVVLGQAIKNLIQPDAGDDELDPEALARKLAAEELSFLMGTMVIVREFGGAAQLLTGAEGVRMGYGGPAGLRAVGEVYGLATQAGQLEFDRAFRRSAINTLGALTGLPSAQVNRTIDGIEAVVEGEVEGVGAVVAPFTGVQR